MLGGEEWVLGKTPQDLDQDAIRQKLSDRYNSDFVTEWNTVLKTSSVATYQSYPDADKKLEKLTLPTSPLLELLYFISHNSDVAPADAKAHFAPVAAVEPPGPPDKLPDHYVVPSNKDYVDALTALGAAIHGLAQNQGAPDPAQLKTAGDSADAASQTVTKIISVGAARSAVWESGSSATIAAGADQERWRDAEARTGRYRQWVGQGVLRGVRGSCE